MRPPSSAASATERPPPTLPRSASSGSSHSSRTSGTVDEPRRPILSSCLPAVSPRVPPATTKALMPLRAGRRVGLGPHDEHAGAVARGDPLLGAVEPPAAGGALGRRRHRRRIGSGLRLRQPERADERLPRGQPRHPRALLLVGAELDDDLADHVGHRHRHRHRRVGARDLGHRQRVGDHARLRAAERLGKVHAEQAEAGQRAQLLDGKRARAIARRRPRRQLARRRTRAPCRAPDAARR